MEWYWQKRGDKEFTLGTYASMVQGWEPAKADLQSRVSPRAEIFVRELVQNFVDAAKDSAPKNQVRPKLTFQFVEFSENDSAAVEAALDLPSLSRMFSTFSDRQKREMRFEDSSVLDNSPAKLRLLVVSEQGTSGMYGQWHRTHEATDAKGNAIQNKMRDALLATVRDSSFAGSGLGSFGEGKKAVIGISKTRTVFAYTAFYESLSADNVSRRFMGSTYWQNFVLEGTKYSGFSMIGDQTDVEKDSIPKPYVDAEADELIESLQIPGLSSRAHGGELETGTTYVFVDPEINADQVAIALKRNWWPLMRENEFDFEIKDEFGNLHDIPNLEELEPFEHLFGEEETKLQTDWDIATGPSVWVDEIQGIEGGAGYLKLGIDMRPVEGFSMKNPDDNWSIVALIRNGMLISYQQFPKNQRQAAPFVRGVFVVDSKKHKASEEMLRMVEPPLHNRWEDNEKNGLDPKSVRHAKQVAKETRAAIKNFRDKHADLRSRHEHEMPLLREKFAVRKGVGKKTYKKTPGKSFFEMHDHGARTFELNPTTRLARASRSLSLSNLGQEEASEIEVSVKIGWMVLQDGAWVDLDPMIDEQVEGFPENNFTYVGAGKFTGFVTSESARFTWSSPPYSDLWTLRPFMEVEEITEGGVNIGQN